MNNWTEYLCYFLEVINIPELRHHEATIKRGHYGLVDVSAKLEILSKLVNQALETAIFREKLDEIIEQRQALGASRREEALEKGRRRREEKERLKAESRSNGFVDGPLSGAKVPTNDNHGIQNGDMDEKSLIEVEPTGQNRQLDRRLDFVLCAVFACQFIFNKHLQFGGYPFHFISFQTYFVARSSL